MSTPPATDPRLAAFPAALRELLDAELAAGNTIVEVASCFPAPPAGAYVKLARAVSTRPRESTPELHYYDRNTSIYSGEWSDAKRFYFVIEPPHPPPPEPNMDAIRAASNAAAGQSMPEEPTPAKITRRRRPTKSTTPKRPVKTGAKRRVKKRLRSGPPIHSARIDQFKASMVIDYEMWHDGIGYDLSLLEGASPVELTEIERLLLSRGAADWRDVEALAALKSERAKQALRAAFTDGNAEIRGAVVRHAPELVDEAEKTRHLVKALRAAVFYGGLTQALGEVENFHPPEVIDALLDGALNREDGEGPVHFAAMLFFLHGKARVAFDWDHRPFFLRFNTQNREERVTVFKELCERIGVDPQPYLKRRS
jgi:hypothetical protein